MKTSRRAFVQSLGAGAAAFGLSTPRPLAARAASTDTRTPTIVDIHPHIVSADPNRYPITPLGGIRSEWSKRRSVTFEELIAAMDEAGVNKAAVVHSSTTYGYDCSYLADSVALRPDRVTGVFSVDMMAADAPDKIRYWAKERKLGGLRLYTSGLTLTEQSTWMSDPKVFPGLECAYELGLAVCVSLRPAGVPHLMVLDQAVSQVALRHRSYDGAAHRRRSALPRVTVPLRSGWLRQCLSQADHRQHPGLTQGQGLAPRPSSLCS